jgi:hypothetical protein
MLSLNGADDSCHQYSRHSITPDSFYYHPPTLWRRLLCHLSITTMKYVPSPATTLKFMHNITTNFTVRPLLRLSA